MKLLEIEAQAVAAIRAGKVVAFPTDTVYGIGAHAFLPEGLEAIFAMKQRSRSKALPVLLPSLAALDQVADMVRLPAGTLPLLEKYWPGALTVIVPANGRVLPGTLTNGTVAVRVPNHPVALRLLEAAGAPLATTSANISEQASAVSPEEVRRSLQDQVAFILTGGPPPGGLESTIVDMTQPAPICLRAGALSWKAICDTLRECSSPVKKEEQV